MANFSNYSKIQLLVNRAERVLGDGSALITLTGVGGLSAEGAEFILAGLHNVPIYVFEADTPITSAPFFIPDLNAIVGLTATDQEDGTILLAYDNTFAGELPTENYSEAITGMTLTVTNVVDNYGDVTPATTMIHSAYIDSDEGIEAATAAMYELILKEPLADSFQLLRIKLIDTTDDVVTTSITGTISGKAFKEFVA